MSAANPITYRMLHEEAAGMGLCAEFFAQSGIDPDASVACNCKFDEGHEATCDIVAAHELLKKMQGHPDVAMVEVKPGVVVRHVRNSEGKYEPAIKQGAD